MGRLDAVAQRRTLRLFSTGRKSGRERVAPVWFVVDGDALLVQAGAKGQKGWYANVRANPDVRVELGELVLRGRAEVLGPGEGDRVAGLFQKKYLLARIAGWLGSQIGRGKPVRIEIEA